MLAVIPLKIIDMDELAERAKEILTTQQYFNVASVSSEGFPWNTPVLAKFDEALNLYWSSWINAQHSANIRSNQNVFLTLYDSTRKRGDNNRRCLYLSGVSIQLEDASSIKIPLELLYGDEVKSLSTEDFIENGLKRIYKFSPHAAWLNDLSESQVTTKTVKMRIKVPLDKLKKMMQKA